MINLIQDNPFVVGDPVLVTAYTPISFGTVVRITEARYDWGGSLTQLALVFVRLVGRGKSEIPYYPNELRVCKCAARIPKGVSQCQE